MAFVAGIKCITHPHIRRSRHLDFLHPPSDFDPVVFVRWFCGLCTQTPYCHGAEWLSLDSMDVLWMGGLIPTLALACQSLLISWDAPMVSQWPLQGWPDWPSFPPTNTLCAQSRCPCVCSHTQVTSQDQTAFQSCWLVCLRCSFQHAFSSIYKHRQHFFLFIRVNSHWISLH